VFRRGDSPRQARGPGGANSVETASVGRGEGNSSHPAIVGSVPLNRVSVEHRLRYSPGKMIELGETLFASLGGVGGAEIVQ
jgi:hypothetical protein